MKKPVKSFEQRIQEDQQRKARAQEVREAKEARSTPVLLKDVPAAVPGKL